MPAVDPDLFVSFDQFFLIFFVSFEPSMEQMQRGVGIGGSPACLGHPSGKAKARWMYLYNNLTFSVADSPSGSMQQKKEARNFGLNNISEFTEK